MSKNSNRPVLAKRLGVVTALLIVTLMFLSAMPTRPTGSALPTATAPRTAAWLAASPPAVDLLSAGKFAVLAKTGISTTGTTSINGDIGVSPSAATTITGFGLIMSTTGTFSTSTLVVGKVYASDYTAPTPTTMTAAILDMQTAYTDAAGRINGTGVPDYLALGAGDVTSLTLTRGIYKWGTGLLISAAGVTLSGSATDVWIFQIAGDLTVADGAIITLSGGALVSNIFWQVAGEVTLGTTAQMKGNILSQTLIAMNTGAKLNGRALAQSEVTLAANAITGPVSGSSTVPTDVGVPGYPVIFLAGFTLLTAIAVISRKRRAFSGK